MSSLLESAGGAGERLLLRENLSDVSIICENIRFPAHSLLLASQSAVLRSMLSDDFSEKTSRRIVLKDVKPETVELFLEYIYCGRVAFESWRDAYELLRVAHRYQVDPLVQRCGRFLEGVLSIANVCDLYQAAFVYSLWGLKERCLRLIVDAGFILLESGAFKSLGKDAVLELVKSPDLNVPNELTVFRALLRWAPSHCCRLGKRLDEESILAALEPFLGYVCFDDMSDAEKAELPPGVLSRVRPNNRSNRVNFLVPDSLPKYSSRLQFRTDPECVEFVDVQLTCIRFSSDLPLHLIGIRLAVLVSELPLPAHVAVASETSGNLQSVGLATASWRDGPLVGDRKWYEAELPLRQPCRLEPGTVYNLCCMDRTRDAQCPKTTPVDKVLLTERGRANISLHCEDVWGILGLIFI